jgi:hypothetical protein
MRNVSLAVVTLFLAALSVHAQDEISMAFSDSSRPGRLEVSLFSGSISVTGYDGDLVFVQGEGVERLNTPAPEEAEGLRRVSDPVVGLVVEESENQIRIEADMPFHGLSDLTIRVPYETSLRLETMSGNVHIVGTRGQIEVESLSGRVLLEGVGGPALVNSLSGNVTALFSGTVPDMPLSLSAFSGDLDLTLPRSIGATFRMSSGFGEIYTDFDLDVRSSGDVIDESNEERQRARVDRTLVAEVNGGGPEVQLTTFNGNIYVRRGN